MTMTEVTKQYKVKRQPKEKAMNNMTWYQMNELETLTYDMKALLEVVSDGLLNQECPSNPEDSAGVIRQAVNKLEGVREIHEQMWEQQREAFFNGRTDEDADGEEGSDSEDLFSADEAEDEAEDEPTPSFDVKEVGRNEDGSATFMISGSHKNMQRLFQAFFTQAVINGIKYTERDNKKEVAKMEALETARELVTWLSVWESSEDIDYEPECAQKRRELSQALKEAGV